MASAAAGERLDRVEFGLLRTFCTIVECGGYGAAQAQLNVSAASISMKMSALEARIGARLCQRGRIGFRLTEEGEQVYSAARQLFRAHTSFLAEIGNLKGHLVGTITIAMIDATVSNPVFKLQQAIRSFATSHPDVHLTLLVVEPSAIERQLLSGEVQVGIAPFYHHVSNIAYEPLFEEPHSLYCGRSHKLFPRAPDKLKRNDLTGVSYVTRGYLPAATPLYRKEKPSGATVFDMESMVHLIRSGLFVGYVPDHFAKPMVAAGELRAIRPDLFRHVSRFDVATRKGGSSQRIVEAFMTELRVAHGSMSSDRGQGLRSA